MSVVDRLEQSIRDSTKTEETFQERQKKVSSFARLLGTLEFLEITLADHELAVASYLEAHERRVAMEDSWGMGSRDLAPDEIALLEETRRRGRVVHLRIETFYLFARRSLDDAAMLLEATLGRSKTTIGSHGDIAKLLPMKAAELGLNPPSVLVKQVEKLTDSIKQFRDKYVAHTHDWRIMKGTSISADGTVTIAAGKMFPREGEVGVQSEPPRALMARLEAYFDAVFDYAGVF